MDIFAEFIEEVNPKEKYEKNRSTYKRRRFPGNERLHQEKGLKEYSSMGNVFPDAYRVYIGSDNMPHIFKGLKAQFEDNYESAFSYVKQEIVKLIEAGEKENLIFIQNSKLDQRVRFKLLSVYYPEKYFPVCALPSAKDYCDVFGIGRKSADTMMDLNIRLKDWSKRYLPAGWPLYYAMALSEWLRRKQMHLDKSFFEV